MTPEIQKSILRACGRFIRKTLEPIEKRLADMENKSMEVPLDGIVKELLSAEELTTLVDLHVAEAVTKHFEANPIQHGQKGDPGERGEKGDTGEDGEGLAAFIINRDGELVGSTTKGNHVVLGQVVGKDGRDGKDGKDGLSFENAVGEFDAERGFVIRMANGERSAEFVLPYMRHAGFWSEGKTASAGESITHDGALYIAKRDTKAKPCAENGDDWILAARKGRDGKDGRNGIDKTAPVKLGNGNG